MSVQTSIASMFIALVASLAVAHDGPQKWVDLTHDLSAESIYSGQRRSRFTSPSMHRG